MTADTDPMTEISVSIMDVILMAISSSSGVNSLLVLQQQTYSSPVAESATQYKGTPFPSSNIRLKAFPHLKIPNFLKMQTACCLCFYFLTVGVN